MFPKPPRKQNEPSETPAPQAAPDGKKSVIIVPSRMFHKHGAPQDVEGAKEHEIAVQITIPQDGGWGWVVVATAFLTIFFMDGVAFTFGSIFGAITAELKMDQSLVGLINSIAVALYFSFGPVSSALINRFGFRAVAMSGAIISFISIFVTYFATTYATLCIFYGGFAGIGFCMINMSASLVVGFYFEKLRSLALAIATTGSSAGISVMFPLNTYIVKMAGWRSLILLQSGFFGIIYFLVMSFKPVLSLTVSKDTDSTDPTRTVTYLPDLSTKGAEPRTRGEGLAPTATEKMFNAVSNYNFPTAAAVFNDAVQYDASNQSAQTRQAGVAGPSKLKPVSAPPVSKLTLTAIAPKGGISQRQLKQVQSMMVSKASLQDKTKIKNIEVNVQVEKAPKSKKSCWGRLCDWEDHIPQSRPMYRDDVFFDGKMEKLPAYQKSRMETTEQKTGFEYQLAVSRAVTTQDLEEKKGLCTTAARRILATMMDPSLLQKRSFIMVGISGFLAYLGYLVPYIFIKDRNKEAGVDEVHCNWFVSVIGIANAVGRLVMGAVACKADPLKLFMMACFISGITTALSNLSFNVYYQYLFCAVFGFFIASIACLRSMVLVDLYGLEKLTNATGMMLLFQGIGSCISTPAASVVKKNFGYSYSFYIAGFFLFISGLVLTPIKFLSSKEKKIDLEKELKNRNELKNRKEETQKSPSPVPVAAKRRASTF